MASQPVNVHTVVVAGKGTLTSEKVPESPKKRDEIAKHTGLVKVPGSLNLRTLEPVWFDRRAGIEWSYGYLFPARIGKLDVLVNKQLSRYAIQPHLMHVYAQIHLRDTMGLIDGDFVRVELEGDALVKHAMLYDLVYRLRLFRKRIIGHRYHFDG